MRQVTLTISEETYAAAVTRAQREGFATAETYLAELIDANITDGLADFDHRFTPAVIAGIDAAAAEARTGRNLTKEQASQYFSEMRRTWIEAHQP